jgi:TnpA family transposase
LWRRKTASSEPVPKTSVYGAAPPQGNTRIHGCRPLCTTRRWLHASRSFKYFGQGQGVSAYTFVDERNFLWHSLMISAADRESAYVIDGLMCNDVVKTDIHSTDTHGYTEAVFGLTHLLGFSFAPRIKGVGKQTLYIFKPKNQADDDWAIRSDKTINEAIIRENWDDLLRLVATIKLKENTASDIFRRLNSYSRQHALYQAMKAFGQIIKSLFILRYIDDLTLRQAIERQLNKVELANRFTRAVAVGNLSRVHTSGKGRTGSCRGLQPPDQKQHHLLELSLPDQTG